MLYFSSIFASHFSVSSPATAVHCASESAFTQAFQMSVTWPNYLETGVVCLLCVTVQQIWIKSCPNLTKAETNEIKWLINTLVSLPWRCVAALQQVSPFVPTASLPQGFANFSSGGRKRQNEGRKRKPKISYTKRFGKGESRTDYAVRQWRMLLFTPGKAAK